MMHGFGKDYSKARQSFKPSPPPTAAPAPQTNNTTTTNTTRRYKINIIPPVDHQVGMGFNNWNAPQLPAPPKPPGMPPQTPADILNKRKRTVPTNNTQSNATIPKDWFDRWVGYKNVPIPSVFGFVFDFAYDNFRAFEAPDFRAFEAPDGFKQFFYLTGNSTQFLGNATQFLSNLNDPQTRGPVLASFADTVSKPIRETTDEIRLLGRNASSAIAKAADAVAGAAGQAGGAASDASSRIVKLFDNEVTRVIVLAGGVFIVYSIVTKGPSQTAAA